MTRHNNQILNKTPKKDQNQLWTLEHKEGSETQVAIKSNVDGKYLRAKAGNAYGAVEVGGRQWWELEEGHAHGAYWMKSLDFPNAYLCNANGSYIDDNKIYMCTYFDIAFVHRRLIQQHRAKASELDTRSQLLPPRSKGSWVFVTRSWRRCKC